MDQKIADKISADMQAAARTIAAKYGLAFAPQRGTYSSTDYNFKASFKDVVQPASGEGPAQTAALLGMCRMYGVDPSKQVIGRGGISYTLVDFQARAHKYPWVGQDALGNKLRFTDEIVQRQCKLAAQPA